MRIHNESRRCVSNEMWTMQLLTRYMNSGCDFVEPAAIIRRNTRRNWIIEFKMTTREWKGARVKMGTSRRWVPMALCTEVSNHMSNDASCHMGLVRMRKDHTQNRSHSPLVTRSSSTPSWLKLKDLKNESNQTGGYTQPSTATIHPTRASNLQYNAVMNYWVNQT